MARIRIVDEWLRSPVSQPIRERRVLVVARSWAEQRVLMRAFSASVDQTRPTILLHGSELAIGPASPDPHGEWGIHVSPNVEGRAQELREALETAARLLAGSKGTPSRLRDEESTMELKATNLWDKNNSDSDAPHSASSQDSGGRFAAKTAYIKKPASPRAKPASPSYRKTPPFWGNAYDSPELQKVEPSASEMLATPKDRRTLAAKRKRPIASRPPRKSGAATALGFADSGNHIAKVERANLVNAPQPGIASEAVQPSNPPPNDQASKPRRVTESIAKMVGKTMPLGLHLSEPEREILNALGHSPYLSAGDVGRLLVISDPIGWMSVFMDKLAGFGLELVTPGEDLHGEPTYVLAR